MFKKLIIIFLTLTTLSQISAHKDDQIGINQQEALLFSSIKNYNKEELTLIKEYMKSLKKMALITAHHINDEPQDDFDSMLEVRIATTIMKIAKMKGIYPFIQTIHIHLCAMCSLVENKHLELDYEIVPFVDGKSASYIASLTEQLLEKIKGLQN